MNCAEHRTATEHAQMLRGQVSTEWGSTPDKPDHLPEWAARVANKRAETDPRLADAARTIEAATADRKAMSGRHKRERLALLVSEYGAERVRRDHLGMRVVNPHRDARDARVRVAQARAEADELRSLPITDAVRRIEAIRVEQEHARQRATERARKLDPSERDAPLAAPGRDGQARGL